MSSSRYGSSTTPARMSCGVTADLRFFSRCASSSAFERVRVAPRRVVLRAAGDRSEHGPVAAGRDQQLHRVEQPRVALGHERAAPVGVPEVLPDGLGHRLGAARLLALDQRERDAVHEQHLVRHDALLALGAGDVHPELRDHHEVVPAGCSQSMYMTR